MSECSRREDDAGHNITSGRKAAVSPTRAQAAAGWSVIHLSGRRCAADLSGRQIQRLFLDLVYPENLCDFNVKQDQEPGPSAARPALRAQSAGFCVEMLKETKGGSRAHPGRPRVHMAGSRSPSQYDS